nr:MAG TPA: hypothetical protein [Caudoviricetes sp.]
MQFPPLFKLGESNMLAFISFVGGSLTTMISLSYLVVSMG